MSYSFITYCAIKTLRHSTINRRPYINIVFISTCEDNILINSEVSNIYLDMNIYIDILFPDLEHKLDTISVSCLSESNNDKRACHKHAANKL